MISCPRCSNSLLIDQSLAGQVVACPYCGQQISIDSSPIRSRATRTTRRKKNLFGLDGYLLWGTIATAALLLCGVVYLLLDAQGATPLPVKARVKAREAVLQVLKYPRDAELSLASEFSQPFVGECNVHGTVKLVNGLGVKLTHDYYVTMGIDSNGELSIKSINFDPPAQ